MLTSLAPSASDNILLRGILYALMNNGLTGLAPEASSNILLRAILYQLTAGGGSSSDGVTIPFATSIAAAQAAPSSSLAVGDIIWILNAVNPNQLSAYQVISGTPTQGSPQQFQPNDNNALTYSLTI